MYSTIYQSLHAEEANAEHLGGKGFGLYWMQSKGINVPPALIIPTTVCALYRKSPKTTMKQIKAELPSMIEFFKEKMGYMPLLSVRSGARVSMPGMMDTILNVGISGYTMTFWENKLGAACAMDCEKRLHHMYCKTVLGMDDQQVALGFSEAHGTQHVPVDLNDQLLNCIEAVFKSWDNDRAIYYRKMNNIPNDWGTAVVVQAMVFGNMNENSGTGVLFTRNPDSGENVITGEFLINAQGEDVVDGSHTPMPLKDMKVWNANVYAELLKTVSMLETLKCDVQDVEFTIQDGKLYILQTRNAKRSAKAAVVIAVDMYSEKLINKVEAVGRVSAKQYDLCQQPLLDPKFVDAPLFTGLPACTGVVTGVVCLSSAAAINCKEPAILVTQETTPDDIEGMFCAHGILTMTGGATSHAAVVARGMNRPCVVGLSQSLSNFVEGETISICGATGRVWKGAVPVIDGSQSPHLLEFKNLLWSVSGATPIDSGAGDEVLVQASRYFHKPADFLTIVKSYAQDTKVYVDCRTAWGSAEREFFGDFVADHAKAENHAVCNLLKYSTKDWSAAMVANVVLITFEEQKTFKSMRVVQTLEDMIMAEGEVIWDVTAVHTEAAKKVMQWQEGKVKPVTIGQSTSHDANSKTFLTEAQVVVGYLK